MAQEAGLPRIRTKNVKVGHAELRLYAFTGLATLEIAWGTYLLTLAPKPAQVVAALWVFGFSLAGLCACLLVFKSGRFRATWEGYWWFRIAHLVGIRGFAVGALLALWPFIGLPLAALLSALVVLSLGFFFKFVAPVEGARPRRRR